MKVCFFGFSRYQQSSAEPLNEDTFYPTRHVLRGSIMNLLDLKRFRVSLISFYTDTVEMTEAETIRRVKTRYFRISGITIDVGGMSSA